MAHPLPSSGHTGCLAHGPDPELGGTLSPPTQVGPGRLALRPSPSHMLSAHRPPSPSLHTPTGPHSKNTPHLCPQACW